MKPAMTRRLAASLLAVAAAGCVSMPRTSLEANWANPQFAGMRFTKVVIVTVSDLEFGQRIFQDELARRLQAEGVNAVPSHRFFSSSGQRQREELRRIIADAGADGVLFARAVSTETVRQQQASIAGGVPLAATAGLYNFWAGSGFGVAGIGVVAAPSAVTGADTTTDVFLFAVRGEKLVWSARTRTTDSDQGNLTPLVSGIVATVVEAMRRDRVI